MRAGTITAVLLLVAPAMGASRNAYHPGFVRRNGTYVAPHFHTEPRQGHPNNWSSSGNVNPPPGRSGAPQPRKPKPPPTSHGGEAPQGGEAP
jgi:hypothetical protein